MCRIYLFDPDAIEVVDESTEPRILQRSARQALQGTQARYLRWRALLATGGTDVAPASAESNAASRREDGSALRGGRRDRVQEHDSPRIAYRRESLLYARGRARGASGQQKDGCRPSARAALARPSDSRGGDEEPLSGCRRNAQSLTHARRARQADVVAAAQWLGGDAAAVRPPSSRKELKSSARGLRARAMQGVEHGKLRGERWRQCQC